MSKTRKNTKEKGSSFERECCEKLSLWFSEGEKDYLFTRTDASGARFSQRKKSNKETTYQGGDITFSDPEGELLIKCWSLELKTGYSETNTVKDKEGNVIKKSVKSWDILDCIDSAQKKPLFIAFWEQCLNDATASNKEPVLIFRRNGRTICVCFRTIYYNRLASYYGGIAAIKTISLSYEDTHLTTMLLKDFTNWILDIKPFLRSSLWDLWETNCLRKLNRRS